MKGKIKPETVPPINLDPSSIQLLPDDAKPLVPGKKVAQTPLSPALKGMVRDPGMDQAMRHAMGFGKALTAPVDNASAADESRIGAPAEDWGPNPWQAYSPAPSQQQPPVITPVDASRLDGQGRLRQLVEEAFAYRPDDTVQTISFKQKRKTEFLRRLPLLGNEMNADEAEAIFEEWYPTVAGQQETPVAAFSPEAQAMIEEAYGGNVPRRRIVGGADVDQSQLGMIGGMALASLFRGQGLRDVLPVISEVMRSTQAGADMDYEARVAQENQRRQVAQAKLQRLLQVEDYNSTQEGYAARDGRIADRQLESNLLIGKRQEDADERKSRQAFLADIRKMLLTGDTRSAEGMADLYEEEYGQKLPASVRNLFPTAAQRATEAGIARTTADAERLRQVTAGLKFRNEVDEATMHEVIQQVKDQAGITSQQLRKIKIEVERLPEWLDTKTRAEAARAAAATLNAKASMIRAQKAGASGGGGDDAAKARKARIDELAKSGTQANADADNERASWQAAVDEVEDATVELNRDQLLYGGTNRAALEKSLERKKKEAARMFNKYRNAVNRQKKVSEELDKIVLGGGK